MEPNIALFFSILVLHFSFHKLNIQFLDGIIFCTVKMIAFLIIFFLSRINLVAITIGFSLNSPADNYDSIL